MSICELCLLASKCWSCISKPDQPVINIEINTGNKNVEKIPVKCCKKCYNHYLQDKKIIDGLLSRMDSVIRERYSSSHSLKE